MPLRMNLGNIAVVLHRPRCSENIGAAARAACNMGVSQFVVVAPHDCDLTQVLKMATHFAADLVEAMEVFEDLETALAPFHYVVGTTARLGSRRPAAPNLRRLVETLIPISQHNRIALLFGPENWGLTNADLRLCHAVVNIPTAEFASLNLAQAVMVLCYEVFLSSRDVTGAFTPVLATHHELEAMYEQLKETFIRISFINPENPDYWMGHIRRFFSRLDMRARDVRMIRGICRQIKWYGSRRAE